MHLGIDVGGTKIQGAYFQQEVVQLTSQVATPASSYEDFLSALVSMVEDVTRLSRMQVSLLGIGVPGTVAEQNVTWVPNLPFLNGRDLAGDLQAQLGAEVVVSNDAQLALLGEMWHGAAHALQSAVLLSVGTGVGGAIMQGGKLVRGIHGSAGAFGWLNLDWRAIPDPEHGYVELQASGRALEGMARQLVEPLSSYELIARARQGDLSCRAAVQQFSAVLGAACASIVSILDPEAVIFAGGLADAFDLLEEGLRAALQTYSSPSTRETPIVVAQLGAHAAAYGALRAAMLQKSLWH